MGLEGGEDLPLDESDDRELSEYEYSDCSDETSSVNNSEEFEDSVGTSGETDVTNSDAESDHCTDSENISSESVSLNIPKQSGIYAKIKILKPGLGTVPEMHFSDEVFSMASLVKTATKFAKVPFFNTSDEDVTVEVPVMSLEVWDSSWEAEEIPEKNVKIMNIHSSDRLEKLLSQFDFSHLNSEEEKAISELVTKFADIFYVNGDKISNNEEFDHEIILKNAEKPIKLKQFRIPFALSNVLEEKVNEMVENDLIEDSNSPWNLPTFLVPKKQGKDGKKKYRLVTDMRKLNDMIVQDVFPLPIIDEVLGQLGNSKYFSVLDLWNGFYQIGLNPASRKYTSFSVCGKKYQYKRLPMGLKNAPACFSRMMTKVLGDFVPDSCLIYLDDVISFGFDLKLSIENLEKIFSRLRENNLKLQAEKCKFLQKDCVYLGHYINREGIFPDTSKFDAVKNFPIPKEKKHVRSFLGLTGFYRKFIADYGKIAQPLNKLTSPNVEFIWEKIHEDAFNLLKGKLLQSPVLAHPDFSQEFILTTDASGVGIAGVLSQTQDGKEKPIGFCSRGLNPREAVFAKDNATETELLAISWAVKYFRPYLYGRHFTVFSDNKALVSLSKMNNENPRMMKYKLELEEFDFTIKHKAGVKNGNADALSRMFTLRVITDDLDKENLIKENHENLLAGHKGVEPTISKIKDSGFTWVNIYKDVKDFVKKCKSCQDNKLYQKTRLPLQITDTPSRPFVKVAIDLVEELPLTPEGFKHILTIQDNFSKFVWAVPLKSKTAEEIAQAFSEELILKAGMPEVVLSDQGTGFESKLFKSLCRLFKIKKIRTSAHLPQANGGLERWHRSLKEYFRQFISNDQSNWIDLLPMACFAHNTTVHAVTKFTPFEILYGFKVNVPSSIDRAPSNEPLYNVDDYVLRLRHNLQNIYQTVRNNLIQNKEKNKRIYDRKTKNVSFSVGEKVQLLVENFKEGRSRKLQPKWCGPYTILEVVGETDYKIQMGRSKKVVHGNKLKSYYD